MGIAYSMILLFSSFDELFCLLTVVLNNVLRSVLGFPDFILIATLKQNGD
jgi:hypothetical protein